MCVSLLLGLASLPAAAMPPPLLLSEDMDDVRLWPAMEILAAPVPGHELLAQPETYDFRPVVSAGESLEGLGSAYWVRITVHNPHAEPIGWRLQHQNGLVIGLDPIVLVAGEQVPGALRALPHRTPVFEVITPARTTQQLYVRRSAPERLVFRASQWRAWSVPAFHAHAQRDAAIKGATYGIMLALAFYNLFLFLSLRIAAYGYYVLFAGLFALTWMSWEGLLLRGLSLTTLPTFLEPAFLASLGSLAAAEFARRLLETAQRAPRLDAYLRALRLLFAAGALATLLAPWGATLATAGTLPLATVPLVGAIIWFRGFSPARFLVLGSALFTVGGVILVVMQLRGISVAGAPLQWVPALQVLELLLMSFALADRTRMLQQDNAAMERAHRAVLERSQQELEAQVRARTAELERAKRRAELLARLDPLTGIANRRALLEEGEAELLRARRYGRALSVIMLDIDHFKDVNDTYGHAGGDRVLTELASQLVSQLREADRVGRLGGEEFAVLLPEAAAAAACCFAERLRKLVAESRFGLGDGSLQVTASLGVATLREEDTGLDALLHRADLALYQAKKAGRNRVIGDGDESSAMPPADHPDY